MVRLKDALIALAIGIILSGFSWKYDNLMVNWGQLIGAALGVAILMWSEKKHGK